ncbi:FliI/YscN family ATPase [Rhodocaloribacter litoris]|uniref:FliI/YscN family ATPase n=1 Tax=Rhodocaloribacter litoris TaxID=2558931 RepID=UPI00141F1EC9|nr:FliI/YscN family ATPase [Rhodocaloribacter litoris]QXD16043.1 FliI/YscN family ATPase [Rhodocaloribacter litoris]GIV59771.1 MAG: ATP synthase [Rhodothermaceae bacterium]
MQHLSQYLEDVLARPVHTLHFGKVQTVVGLLVEARDVHAAVGELCYIYEGDVRGGRRVAAEVVGVRGRTTVLMPLEQTAGLRAGCLVQRAALPLTVRVGDALLGRVIDGHGRPLDGKGPLALPDEQPVNAEPPSPLERRMITEPLRTGIRAIDAFLTLGKGQRIGIFAGSGVGKSTLLGMIARRAQADVNVIALIGERGREVQEFIVDNLGAEGLRRSVVVAVTGDQAAMSRVKGASVALAIAEYFRDRGLDVLLMMDSVTRVAMAQREIGLAVGEPPTTRGYTPSVFALLPRLLERAGPGARGTITGIFTVLVDGDDLNEPIGDAVRGILDGHIVLSRRLAHANHFPAIDVLQSVSRVMPRVAPEEAREAAHRARRLLAAYRDAEDLIRIGAYQAGTSPDTDAAIAAHEPLKAFLQQRTSEAADPDAARTLIALMQRLDG